MDRLLIFTRYHKSPSDRHLKSNIPVAFASYFRLNPSDAEVDQLKKEIDEDDSGDIDFDEFLELMNSTTLRYVSADNFN